MSQVSPFSSLLCASRSDCGPPSTSAPLVCHILQQWSQQKRPLRRTNPPTKRRWNLGKRKTESGTTRPQRQAQRRNCLRKSWCINAEQMRGIVRGNELWQKHRNSFPNYSCRAKHERLTNWIGLPRTVLGFQEKNASRVLLRTRSELLASHLHGNGIKSYQIATK